MSLSFSNMTNNQKNYSNDKNHSSETFIKTSEQERSNCQQCYPPEKYHAKKNNDNKDKGFHLENISQIRENLHRSFFITKNEEHPLVFLLLI